MPRSSNGEQIDQALDYDVELSKLLIKTMSMYTILYCLIYCFASTKI